MITVYHIIGATNTIYKEGKEQTEKMKEKEEIKEDTSCSETFGGLGFPFLGRWGRYSLIYSVFIQNVFL